MPRNISVAIRATKKHCNKNCLYLCLSLAGLCAKCRIFGRNEYLRQEIDPPYLFIRHQECIEAEV
jgi:hypothetical protein